MTKKEKLSYKKELERLISKKQIARIKRTERKLKLDIVKMYLPHFHFKFNKFIVIFCIAAIISYTIAAILLQKYTMTELSPTLTTCFFAFFGTELIGLAGIKCFDTKFSNDDIDSEKANIDDDDAVG